MMMIITIMHTRTREGEDPLEHAAGRVQVKIRWRSDNPWEHAAGKVSIGKCRRASTVISEVSISGVQSCP